jgi:hypothetical protein
MWDLLIDSAGTSILELSARAVIGATVALFMLFVIMGVFKRNETIKQYVFVLALTVILIASSILFITALVHMQDTVLVFNSGVINT